MNAEHEETIGFRVSAYAAHTENCFNFLKNKNKERVELCSIYT